MNEHISTTTTPPPTRWTRLTRASWQKTLPQWLSWDTRWRICLKLYRGLRAPSEGTLPTHSPPVAAVLRRYVSTNSSARNSIEIRETPEGITEPRIAYVTLGSFCRS